MKKTQAHTGPAPGISVVNGHLVTGGSRPKGTQSETQLTVESENSRFWLCFGSFSLVLSVTDSHPANNF
jgi:hypothetical protein